MLENDDEVLIFKIDCCTTQVQLLLKVQCLTIYDKYVKTVLEANFYMHGTSFNW